MPEVQDTAELLGAYRKRLLTEGIPVELADELVRQLGSQIADRDGVCVRTAAAL